MDPQVEIISRAAINWPSFKATMNKVLDSRPDYILGSQVTVKEDPELLLYLAAMFGISIKNNMQALREIPHHLLEFLHYTFMVACNDRSFNEFTRATRLSIVVNATLPDVNFVLVTGTLATWYNTITLNLAKDWKYSPDTRLLINKILLLFERQGLGPLFDNYEKSMCKDGTFFLKKR